MARIVVCSCIWFADSLPWGETGSVHRICLGDWWECPVCQYGITGWPNGVRRTMATGWTGKSLGWSCLVLLWYNSNSQLHPSPAPSLRTNLWSDPWYLFMTTVHSWIWVLGQSLHNYHRDRCWIYIIVYAAVYHLSFDCDGGFVYVQMYLFCSYDLPSMLRGSGNHLVATRC
jgi:hypothetical protein